MRKKIKKNNDNGAKRRNSRTRGIIRKAGERGRKKDANTHMCANVTHKRTGESVHIIIVIIIIWLFKIHTPNIRYQNHTPFARRTCS